MQHKLRPTDASPKEHGRKASSYINTPVHSAALGQQGPNAFFNSYGNTRVGWRKAAEN